MKKLVVLLSKFFGTDLSAFYFSIATTILAMVAKPTAAATTNEAQVANRCDLCKSSILSSIFRSSISYTLDKDSPHHAWQTVKDAHLTLVPQDHRIQSPVEKVCLKVPLFVRVL